MPKAVEIPADLRSYLNDPKAKREFRFTSGEIRECALKRVADLSNSTFDVIEPGRSVPRGKQSAAIRHEFTGVDLIQACNSHSPDGILIWFIELQQYGSWDCDHHKLLVFPDANWEDICRCLRRYVNAQWFPGLAPLAIELRPWE